jgi:hypothetical protein
MREPAQHKRRRGSSGVEYLVVLVLLSISGIVVYRAFGKQIKCKVATATALFGGDKASACSDSPDESAGGGPVASNGSGPGSAGPPPGVTCVGSQCNIPGSNCFVAGTPVRVEGGARPIEQLRAGDRVLARDVDSGELAYHAIVGTTEHVAPSLVELTLARPDGSVDVIQATPQHPFWVRERGWVGAGALTPGQDTLSSADDAPLLLLSVRSLARADTVYNLEVEGAHTFFVGDVAVWVHNYCPQTDPRFDSLSQDPAHGTGPESVTPGSLNEAVVGLTLENQGKVPGPIERADRPESEFKDGKGQYWDVKAPVSGVNLPEPAPPKGKKPKPPRAPEDRPGAFKLASFEKTIDKEVAKNNNLMIDTSQMTPADAAALEAYVAGRSDLNGKVLFYPDDGS